jgi:hypothetical protein
MSREQEVMEGREAGRLLSDPAFDRATTRLREQYLAEFEMSTTSAQRDQIHARLRALADLRGLLDAAVNAGNVAGRDPRVVL